MTCRDLTKVDVMQCRYVLLTAADGEIVNDPVLLRLAEDRFWLALARSRCCTSQGWLRARVRRRDPRGRLSPMQVQGPRSKDVIRTLFGDDVAGLRYYFCARGRGREHPRRRLAGRLDRRGGYEIYLRDSARQRRPVARGRNRRPHEIRAIAPSRPAGSSRGSSTTARTCGCRGHAAA
ncbi:MAG: hypothetical protein U0V56_05315 [Actinomycetota bacterium]